MAKVRKEKNKKTGVSGMFLKLTVVAASAYLLVAFVGGQLQVASKQRELEEIQAKTQKISEKNEEISILMNSGDEAAYIERVAREKLGYVMPDEKVFVDISGQ